MLKVGILLLDGFRLTTLAAFIDTLKGAGTASGFEIDLMTPTGQPCEAEQGLSIPVPGALLWPEAMDYVVVMGSVTSRLWRWTNTISRYLRAADRLGVPIAGIGKGVETLARLGFCDGETACVSVEDLGGLSAKYPDVRFVAERIIHVSDRRITCLGGVAASDLAAFLIERHGSREAAHRAVVRLNREGYRWPETPPPVDETSHRYANDKVRACIVQMAGNIETPKAIDAIAAELQISRRQLERLFQGETGESAAKTYLRIRLNRARRLFGQTSLSATEIAFLTGFVDGAHLSRSMKAMFGETPRQLRARQSAEAPSYEAQKERP